MQLPRHDDAPGSATGACNMACSVLHTKDGKRRGAQSSTQLSASACNSQFLPSGLHGSRK